MIGFLCCNPMASIGAGRAPLIHQSITQVEPITQQERVAKKRGWSKLHPHISYRATRARASAGFFSEAAPCGGRRKATRCVCRFRMVRHYNTSFYLIRRCAGADQSIYERDFRSPPSTSWILHQVTKYCRHLQIPRRKLYQQIHQQLKPRVSRRTRILTDSDNHEKSNDGGGF